MALPHYTSKIRSHEDLESLTTYGFRGEALNAICTLAEVTVVTKTENDLVASTNVLDSKGRVVKSVPSAVGQGTIISLTQLFHNVPG